MPKIGVINVGEVFNTLEPVPVDVITPVPPFATANVPANVTTPLVAVEGVNPVVPPLNVDTPAIPVAEILILPELFVIPMPVPAVNVVLVKPVPLPISNAPLAGAVVKPVPPEETANVADKPAAVPLVF